MINPTLTLPNLKKPQNPQTEHTLTLLRHQCPAPPHHHRRHYPPPPSPLLLFLFLLPPPTHALNLSTFTVPDPSLPAGVDIFQALIGGHIFNVAASLLNASGVLQDLQKSEAGAGISIFIPTDAAFADLPPEYDPKPLPAAKKSLLLKFHVLHSYYPLGSLESIVNPVEPTLATEENGAGTFTLNISKVNGSVSLDSGLDLAVITQTVFDQNPVAVFGISNVLLPKEIFGGVKGSAEVMEMKNDSDGGGGYLAAETPEFGGEIGSDAGGGAKQGIWTLFCTVGLILYL